jgi:hypothetical protein
MRTFLFFILLISNLNLVNGQQFANHLPALGTTYPFFNAHLIKEKKIKKLITTVMYKSPNRKLVYSAEFAIYLFSRNGDVEKYTRANRSGNSINSNYFLSKNGLLATEHIQSAKKDIFKSYVYNEKNLVTEIQEAKAQTAKVIKTDKFKYEFFTEFQYKKYWLNSEGLTYKYTVVDLDDKGRVEEERTRFIRGASRETIYYTYENGWLTSYSYNVKEVTRRETKYILEYAENGDLLVMNESRDGALIARTEYLYEEGVLIAILEKNIASQQIKITKVKYEYFEG